MITTFSSLKDAPGWLLEHTKSSDGIQESVTDIKPKVKPGAFRITVMTGEPINWIEGRISRPSLFPDVRFNCRGRPLCAWLCARLCTALLLAKEFIDATGLTTLVRFAMRGTAGLSDFSPLTSFVRLLTGSPLAPFFADVPERLFENFDVTANGRLVFPVGVKVFPLNVKFPKRQTGYTSFAEVFVFMG